MSQTTYVPKFSFLHWIKMCKEPPCPLSPCLEFWRTLQVSDWYFGSWSWWWGVYRVPKNLYSEIQLPTSNKKVQRTQHVLEVLYWSCGGLWRFLTGVLVLDHDGEEFIISQTTYVPKFSFLHWIKRCKEPSCPWSPGLELWRTLEVPDWGFGSWSWWGGVKNVPNNLCSEIQLSTLNKKVAKNPHVLQVLVWSCGEFWCFLTRVLVPYHDGDGSTMYQTIYVPKFSFLHWIKRCKEPSCPRSPGLGIWRTLEVPDWGFGFWS